MGATKKKGRRTMRVSSMSTSYEPSTDANTAPEFSSASLIGITEGTVVSTVSLFVINAIIFLQLIIMRLIGISKHIYMKSKTAFVEPVKS